MEKSITFVTQMLSRGGAEKMLAFVANNCVGKFDKVYIISFYTERVEVEVDEGVEIIFLPGNLRVPNLKRTFFTKILDNIQLIKLLRREIKRINPNLICSFGIGQIYLCVLAALGLNSKIVGSERRSPIDLSFSWQKISKFFYSKCDGMVFQLEDAKNFYSRKVIKKSVVIPNSYIPSSQCKEVPSIIRKKVVAAGAARFEFQKGFDLLIKAFNIVHKKHPDYKLVIYGQGKERKNYDILISQLKLNGIVKFPGIVDNLAREVYDASVFVLPSRNEGIPNALLEVMGVGVPTVSCDCPPGGPRFLTDGGQRGLLVPVDDYKAIAKSICTLIEDTDLATQISHSSLEIRKELSVDIISKKWIEFFKKVLTNEKAGYENENKK